MKYSTTLQRMITKTLVYNENLILDANSDNAGSLLIKIREAIGGDEPSLAFLLTHESLFVRTLAQEIINERKRG